MYNCAPKSALNLWLTKALFHRKGYRMNECSTDSLVSGFRKSWRNAENISAALLKLERQGAQFSCLFSWSVKHGTWPLVHSFGSTVLPQPVSNPCKSLQSPPPSCRPDATETEGLCFHSIWFMRKHVSDIFGHRIFNRGKKRVILVKRVCSCSSGTVIRRSIVQKPVQRVSCRQWASCMQLRKFSTDLIITLEEASNLPSNKRSRSA